MVAEGIDNCQVVQVNGIIGGNNIMSRATLIKIAENWAFCCYDQCRAKHLVAHAWSYLRWRLRCAGSISKYSERISRSYQKFVVRCRQTEHCGNEYELTVISLGEPRF